MAPAVGFSFWTSLVQRTIEDAFPSREDARFSTYGTENLKSQRSLRTAAEIAEKSRDLRVRELSPLRGFGAGSWRIA
jgi:hypothetical protein